MARKAGQDAEITRKAIAEAAADVFSREGFAGASLSDIAKQARVTKSLIHHHFGSKQGLWQEVIEARFQEFIAEQRRIFASTSPAPQFARESVAAFFRFLQRHPRLLRLMWWSQAEHGSSHAPQDERVTQELADLVRLGIDRVRTLQEAGGIRRDLDPRFVLSVFIGMIRHWFVLREDYPAALKADIEAVDEAALQTMTEVFLHGVLAE